MTMPGVQNPHCDPPVATNALAKWSRCAGSRPSTVVTDRPSTRVGRGDARDPGVAVDQDGAAAALALRRAAVLHRHEPEPLAQDREQRLARLDRHLGGLAVAGEAHPIRHSHLRLGRIGACSLAAISSRWPAASSCSRRAAATTTAASSGNTLAPESDEEFTDLSPAVLSSDLYASETPQRFAFALTAKQGYASQGTVAVAVAPSGDGQSVVNADR